MKNDPKLVAIAYDLSFRHAAEIFSGASDYIHSEGLNWQLLPLNFGFEAKLMELAASGRLSGAIGTFVSDEWIRGLHAHQVAAVNLFNFSKIESVPTISLDDATIGQAAAQHLLEQGAKSLSFIGQDQAYFNQLRRRAFIESCPPGHYLDINPMAPRRVQAERFKNAKCPIGVLCSSDRIARELCNEAKRLGINAGKELLVIGVGNEPIESSFAGIGLSSFDIPSREIGHLAAKNLDFSLKPEDWTGSHAAAEKVTATLISRESTLSSPQARLAERAMAVITESIAQADFDVAYLCRRLGVSRRTLELTTRQQLRQSPYQILSEKRLNKAKELLRSTNQTIAKVGQECGYPEPHHFSAWFKQRTQMSPRSFRSDIRLRSPTSDLRYPISVLPN
jgi:DNA-binding LacI/PurR family transcriptional regulator